MPGRSATVRGCNLRQIGAQTGRHRPLRRVASRMALVIQFCSASNISCRERLVGELPRGARRAHRRHGPASLMVGEWVTLIAGNPVPAGQVSVAATPDAGTVLSAAVRIAGARMPRPRGRLSEGIVRFWKRPCAGSKN